MRVLYLPVEISKRELDSKLLVALTSLKNNHFDVVYVGRDVELFNRMNKPGVVLLKSAAGFELNMINSLKKLGHVVYSLDEEGIVPPINDPSINTRFSFENLKKLDGLLVNGPLELLSYPNEVCNRGGVTVVGNPRFDFYKHKYRGFYDENKNIIRSEFGNRKILLIASRFGDVNIHSGVNTFNLLKSLGYIDSDDAELYFKGFHRHTYKVFKKFLKLPDLLARSFPDHLVVVRPHPSENHAEWLSNCTESNIIVTSKYDIASWLACAECLIHNGCTTAVEAVAMKVPVISYMPVTSDEFDLNYSNEVGLIVTNFNELRSAVDKVINCISIGGKRSIKSIIDFDDDENSSSKIASLLSLKMPIESVNKSKRIGFLIKFYFFSVARYFLNSTGLKKSYSLQKYPFHSLSKYKVKVINISSVFDLGLKLKVKKVGIDIVRILKE